MASYGLDAAESLCAADPYALVNVCYRAEITDVEFGALAERVLREQLPDGPVGAATVWEALRMMPACIYRGRHRAFFRDMAMRFWTPERMLGSDSESDFCTLICMMVDAMPPQLACAVAGRALDVGWHDRDSCAVEAGVMPLGTALAFWARPNGHELYERLYRNIWRSYMVWDMSGPMALSLFDEMLYCPVDMMRRFARSVMDMPVRRLWPLLLLARGRAGAEDVCAFMWARICEELNTRRGGFVLDRMLAEYVGLPGLMAEGPKGSLYDEAHGLLDEPYMITMLPREFVEMRLSVLSRDFLFPHESFPSALCALVSARMPSFFFRGGDGHGSCLWRVRQMVGDDGFVRHGASAFAVLRVASSDPAAARMIWGGRLRVEDHAEELGGAFVARAFPGLLPGYRSLRSREDGRRTAKRRRRPASVPAPPH